MADPLIPVNAILVILGILIPFLPREMAYHLVSWMIVEINELYLNLMCFELPRNLDVISLQI